MQGAQLFRGPVRFILGGSGHIAGIINPPDGGKYDYRVTDELLPDPDNWAAGAEKHPGSWWPEWQRWIAPMSGDLMAARQPGSGKYKVLEDAPGSYVKARSGTGKVISVASAPVPAATKQHRNQKRPRRVKRLLSPMSRKRPGRSKRLMWLRRQRMI